MGKKYLAEKRASGKVDEKKDGDEEEEDTLDVLGVENIADIGDGVPLYEKFAVEDWTLCQLRFELWIMATSFVKDANDPDRVGMPVEHVAFYYYLYFKKALYTSTFGVNDIKDVLAFVKDTIAIKDNLLFSQLNEVDSLDIFLKLTEATRRERQRRIDAGDETARIK